MEGLEVPVAHSPTRLYSFTFVPAVKRLPSQSGVTREHPLSTSNTDKGVDGGKGAEKMSGSGVFKAEIVYIGDSDEGEMEELNTRSTKYNFRTKPDAQAQHKVADYISQSTCAAQTKDEILSVKQEQFNPKQKAIHTQTKNVPQPDDSNHDPEAVSSSLSVANSMEMLGSLASSKESILSDDWGWPKSSSFLPPSEGSPLSLSRGVSPCSSIKSGTFTPSILTVKRCSLAPGSSLVRMSPSCFSSTNSLAETPCPLSPKLGRPYHRPPPTQLSLLTAILRKGRLPVLSSSQQRPYSPCWPISPSSLSSCNACSAASSLTSISREVSRPQSPTSTETPYRPSMQVAGSLLKPYKSSIVPPHPWPSTVSHSPRLPGLDFTHKKISAKPPTYASSQAKMASPIKDTVYASPTPPPYSRLSSSSSNHSSLTNHTSKGFRKTLLPAATCPKASPSLPIQNGSPSLQTSPRPSSHIDRLGLPTAPPSRSLTPSPSLSLRSTPSPSPSLGASDLSLTGEGKKRKLHKIKSSYKALAAIPTNTLLLDQQAIDEQVEKEDDSLSPTDRNSALDTHAEICSPAQLRQQSAELYAAIDEALENPLPAPRSPSVPVCQAKFMDGMKATSVPKSAGRETKYATFNLHCDGPAQRIMEKDHENEFHPNPFTQLLEELSAVKPQKPQHPVLKIHKNDALASSKPANRAVDRIQSPESPTAGRREVPEPAVPPLIIIEREEEERLTMAETSSECSSTSSCASQVNAAVRETHV